MGVKNSESFYISKGFINDKGVRTSVIVRKLGTLNDLLKEHGPTRDDVMVWTREEAKLPFLQAVYYGLQLHKTCRKLKAKYKFGYDINGILSDLTYFSARPVYLQDENRIKAHFLICFLALLSYRLLEKKLGGKYTCEEILDTLKAMNFAGIQEQGFIPLYKREKITDDLHNVCGFRTDYQFITKSQMKTIQKKSFCFSQTVKDGIIAHTQHMNRQSDYYPF